jgi:hypothetical protein
MRRTIALLLAAAGIVAAIPASASADEAIAETERPAPLASFGGWSAWSAADAGGRYLLKLRTPQGEIRDAPYPSSKTPWDITMGPDATGRAVAILRRCRPSGCDLERLDLLTGRIQPLRSVSSPRFDEAAPAIWGSTVAFTRRIRGCDVPYVKDLRSRAPSRRLLRAKCLQTGAGQVSVRGTRIVVSSVDLTRADAHGAGLKVSEIRRYSATKAGSSVLLRQGFGEEPNLFGQIAQDGRDVWTVRYGTGRGSFLRLRADGTHRQEIWAFRTLAAGFTRTPELGSLYVELRGEGTCSDFDVVPCRIVAAPGDPFGSTPRALTPELTVAYAGPGHFGQPLAFSGRLFRRIVRAGRVLRTEAMPGVSLDLRARVGESPERFTGTGLTATTAADGRWKMTLPALTGNPWFTAVAATPGIPTWAGRGTVGGTMP